MRALDLPASLASETEPLGVHVSVVEPDNYASIDIRAVRNFYFSDTHSLSVFVEIANLFNRENECCVE